VIDSFVNHCDLFATLLEAAGVKLDAEKAKQINSPGQSYLSQLRGAAAEDWRTAQILEYGNARMIRTDQYKLILRYPFRGVRYPDELYDLKADPRETVNRFAEPQLAGVIKDLSARIDEFFEKYTVPGHDGLHLEDEPQATPASPWLRGTKK
jgi:arylsulfatase A-like enzyme